LRFDIDPNGAGVRELCLTISPHECECRLVDADGEHVIAAGFGRWIEGTTDMPGVELHHGYRFHDSPVVARAAWMNPDHLKMVWIYPETAFRDTVECYFHQDTVVFSRTVNVNSGPLAQDDLTGKRAAPSR